VLRGYHEAVAEIVRNELSWGRQTQSHRGPYSYSARKRSMETINCNLCGSNSHRIVYVKPDMRYFRDELFTVVECSECGLGFVNPRPDAAEMSRYYPSEYFAYDELEADYHGKRYDLEARIIASQINGGAGHRLLDIGCANGTFARRMQQLGWEVEGVEVSRNSRVIDDIKIYREAFPEIPVNEPRFDAITAWAVLEHVHDPMAHFRKMSSTLKPGGIAVFLVTNFESISSRALFREDVPRHLYFFTERTVAEYLSRNGMRLISTEYSNNVYAMPPVGWLRYYLYRAAGKKYQWKDVPSTRPEYLAKRGLTNSLSSTARYVISHPLTAIDRLLTPVLEQWQILNRSYGIVTYVAVKTD
jgi:SAM-dependent methyltransferase